MKEILLHVHVAYLVELMSVCVCVFDHLLAQTWGWT